jgi:two-component system sensor histidine kinase KdpD
LEFLETPGTDDSQAEMASLALTEALRLDRFITNLLDMTKLELGGLSVTLSPVTVQDVVVSVLQRAQSLLLDHRIVVHIQDLLPPASANFDLLEQALFNIIDNAGKYSPRHSAIEIRALSKSGRVLIEIMDHGCGISDQLSKVIFRKFSRVSLGDAKTPGTGLGLAIAKGFLEVMGGTIAAANRPDKRGAIFTITLPAILPG